MLFQDSQDYYGEYDLLIEFREIGTQKKQLQAATLAYEGFSYHDIETYLDLPPNTLLVWEAWDPDRDWQTEEDDDKEKEAMVFTRVREAIERTDPRIDSKIKQEQHEKDQKAEENTKQLKSKQTSAIDLLASGKSVSEVAAEVGVTRQTIYNWQAKDEEFQDEFGQKLAELKQAQSQRTAEIVEKAFAAIESLLDSEDEKVRLKAATEVLKGLRWNATTDLDAVLIGAQTSLETIHELKSPNRRTRPIDRFPKY